MIGDKILVIAVTGCVSGVAHTYMAAEAIREICRKQGWRVQVETQGALGVENQLTPEVIETADVVVLAADVDLADLDRFAGRRIIRTDVRTPLRMPDRIARAVARVAHLQNGYVMDL